MLDLKKRNEEKLEELENLKKIYNING